MSFEKTIQALHYAMTLKSLLLQNAIEKDWIVKGWKLNSGLKFIKKNRHFSQAKYGA